MIRHTSIFFLLFAIVVPNLAAQRALPDDNLAYPVLIILTDCKSNIAAVKASGFFVHADTDMYFVTARHVIFDESVRVQPGQVRPLLCKKAELLSYSKNPKEREQNRFQLDLVDLNAAGRIKGHAAHDTAVVQLATLETGPNSTAAPKPAGEPAKAHLMKPLPGVQVTSIAPSGTLSVDAALIKKLDEVLTSNDIYVLGYPASIGIEQFPQIDYNSPLLRKGIVAGINELNKTFVIDCLTFQGNSGGPVLEIVHEALGYHIFIIGVVSQYVPVTETWVNTTLSYSNLQIHNSGYSIAEPMDSVLELIGK